MSILICALIAGALDCQVNEGGVSPCMVAGQDIGWLLSQMGMMGWFLLITLPSGVLALVVLLIVILVAPARREPSDEIRDLSLGP
jgi:hypothetical protein